MVERALAPAAQAPARRGGRPAYRRQPRPRPPPGRRRESPARLSRWRRSWCVRGAATIARRGAIAAWLQTWKNGANSRGLPDSGRRRSEAMAENELPAREAMEFDVVIVGAGPAGLAAAIRLKQRSPDISVVVVEKGSEVGAHILSGAVIDPIGLDRLLPEWRSDETPVRTPVTSDRFYVLGPSGAVRLPNFALPPLMNNHGNFVVSLGDVCRYLAHKAEALGVEIYPGFAAAELLFEGDAVAGVATGDMGIGKDGQQKS